MGVSRITGDVRRSSASLHIHSWENSHRRAFGQPSPSTAMLCWGLRGVKGPKRPNSSVKVVSICPGATSWWYNPPQRKMGQKPRSVSFRTQEEYARRINAALDFIDRNLPDDIPLAKLAAVACFSPYHFHRLFSAFVGEPPAEYIRRLRLEKAAILLANDASVPVTTIALGCGFSTSALFCRLFKARFGMPPTAWRDGGYENRKNGQTVRKRRKDITPRPAYHWPGRTDSREWRAGMTKRPVVRIEDLPPLRIACVKHRKGYEDSAGIGNAFETLFCWAG